MKKDFFTVFRFSWLLLVAVLAMPFVSYGQDVPTLVCNDNVQISLANISNTAYCGEIFPDAFLEQPAAGDYMLEVGGVTYMGAADGAGGGSSFYRTDADGMIVIDFGRFGGQTLSYKISSLDAAGNPTNSCWGTATFELNVIQSLDLDCPYVAPIHQEVKVTIKAGETSATASIATADACQVLTVTGDGSAKFACDDGNDGIPGNADDGWCTETCIIDDSVPGEVTVSIANAAPIDVVCTVKVTAPECIECITWCPGAIPDAADIEKELAGSCFANPSQVFSNVTEHGDQCSGVTQVVKFSAIVNMHGQDVLVDLGTQAFKVEPISIFAIDATTGEEGLNLFDNTLTGSGISGVPGVLTLPAASVSLNCDQDPDDLSLTGQPMILNHHEPSTDTPCSEPITVHYKVVTEILEDQPVDVDGVWVLLDVLKKETKEVVVCDCADIQPVLDAYTGSKAKVGDVFEIITPIPGVDVAKGTCTEKDLHAVTRPPVTVPYTPYTLDELAAYSCNTTLYTVEDVGEFPACGSGRKFLRQWTLIDWCNGKRKEFTQVIEVKDTKAPVILADEDDLAAETVSTEPWVCSAAIEADGSAFFSDECSDYRVEIEVTDKATGIWIDPSAVGVGTYTVSYVAVDECGNKTKAITKDYVVVDNVKPVPVCEDELVVSVTDDNAGDGGLAKIYAADFNAGSHDAGCGPVTGMKVVRMEDWNVTPVSCDPFTDEIETTTVVDKFGTEETTTELVGIMGDHVKFCCSDVGNENIVVLRVYDAAGNHNDCMVRVTVQNKLTATCEDVVVDLTCLTYSGNPADYNKPGGAGSECTNTALTLVDEQVSINSCGVGKVITYYALEGTGALCKQTINITADGAFDPTSIRWPFHYDDNTYTAVRKELDTRAGSATEGECIENGTEEVSLGNLNCGDDQPICEPTWTDASCGLVGVSVKEEIIEFDANACYKIIKRWTVVDWCTWEANDGSENFDDENDTDRDVFEPCANWCEEDCNRYFFRYADGQVDVDGYYTFDQVIKVVDTEAPTVTCTIDPATLGADCTADITFSASATDGAGCPSSTITYSWTLTDAAGRTVKTGAGATGAMSNLTDGEYTVTYVAADGCGNSSSTTCTIDLVDTKAPTPICYQSLSTAVMAGDDPSVEIWASDYLKEGSDNCPGDLIASFSGTEAVTNMTFTCDDVTGADIEMKVWLWDAAGNADYCFVTIRVDDNGHCGEIGSSAMIAGNIATEYGDDVAEADVMLNSVHPEFPAMRKTQNDGHYAFGGTPLTYDYEISAERNDDYMNGVSTLDLVLIQKHILGLATLDSPYKVIAADINSDQKVSGADLVQLRQLILGVTSELPANDSWRFVDAAQSFATSTSPWPFTEFIDIAALSNSMMTEDFVGVKIGDVNANAQANSLMSAEVRSNGTLNLNITDAAVNAGDLVSVDVTADNFSEVFGYQLTMNHPGLTLKSVEGVALEVTDANLGVREGVLTMSWNDTEGVTASGVLFTLNFNASTALQLSETISINSRITTAEAYVGAELANNDIELTFTNGENTIAAAEYNLYQNEPNPFRAYTDVSFVLPTSGQATISVIDVTGKVVTTVKDQFNKGLNTVRFTKSELGAAAGILYYQLESGEFTATKKMIILN